MYEYKATLATDKDIHDGDTLRLNVDLGFRSWLNGVPFRLNGIDTPELLASNPAGRESRDALRLWVPEGKDLVIITQKDQTEKYGRYLADLYVDGVHLNEKLVQEGLAKRYNGTGPRP